MNKSLLGRKWWVLLVLGVVFLLLGLMMLFDMGLALSRLLIYLAVFFILLGLLVAGWSWRARAKVPKWWLLALSGLVSITAGIMILLSAQRATAIFTQAIGGWAIAVGIAQFVMGTSRKEGRMLYLMNGLVSLLLGFLILYNPFDSAKGVEYLTGIYTILLGIFFAYLSLRSHFKKSQNQNIVKKQAEQANQSSSS